MHENIPQSDLAPIAGQDDTELPPIDQMGVEAYDMGPGRGVEVGGEGHPQHLLDESDSSGNVAFTMGIGARSERILKNYNDPLIGGAVHLIYHNAREFMDAPSLREQRLAFYKRQHIRPSEDSAITTRNLENSVIQMQTMRVAIGLVHQRLAREGRLGVNLSEEDILASPEYKALAEIISADRDADDSTLSGVWGNSRAYSTEERDVMAEFAQQNGLYLERGPNVLQGGNVTVLGPTAIGDAMTSHRQETDHPPLGRAA